MQMKYPNCAVLIGLDRSQSIGRKRTPGFPCSCPLSTNRQGHCVGSQEFNMRFLLLYRARDGTLSANGCWALIIHKIWVLSQLNIGSPSQQINSYRGSHQMNLSSQGPQLLSKFKKDTLPPGGGCPRPTWWSSVGRAPVGVQCLLLPQPRACCQ